MIRCARRPPLALARLACLACVAGLAGVGACGGATTPPPPWQLVWSDEFEGPAGTPPDPARWVHDVGGNGWGNGELEFYTDRVENAALDGAGALVITARAEDYMGRAYTSGRLNTRGLYEATYGRFEASLRLPAGKGLWPAFWMLGGNVADVGWPACGEIDVMENRGADPSAVSGSLHGPGYAGGSALIGVYTAPGGASLADDFHLFAVEWDDSEVRFSVDGDVFQDVRRTRLPAGGSWVFDHPFFLVVDLAVGGTFGGPPDATTVFPQVLRVDYVRAYRR